LLFYNKNKGFINKPKKYYKMNNENKHLKIGFLSFYYPHLGGSGIITSRLARHLAKKGHEVHFIGYDTDDNPSEMENLGIQLHRVRKVDYPCMKNEPYVWTLASRLCEVHKKIGLDLVHANYAIPHALVAYAAREQLKMEGMDLPYVVTGHGSDIHTNGFKIDVNPILQLALNQADALTFVSRDLQKIAEENLGITKESTYIPNFVETDVFYKKSTNLRERLGIPKRAFVIGHVSNFTPIKQVYNFGYLAEHLAQGGILTNIYFLMCGDGRDRAILEERVEKIGASDHFRFTGRLDVREVNDVYNAMDVFLLPSGHEGNPLSLLEAMACQVPVIGANVGGIEEIIRDPNVGVLFESGNIPSLMNTIDTLRNNPRLSHEMGENGLKRVMSNYSIGGVMNQYWEIYMSLLNKTGKKKEGVL